MARAPPVPRRPHEHRETSGPAGAMNRWLVTGAGGMLGQDMVTCLERDGEPVLALTRADLDITDQAAVTATVRGCQPDFVVNCAAWTAVDEAEAHEDEAFEVNGRGAAAGRGRLCRQRRPPDPCFHRLRVRRRCLQAIYRARPMRAAYRVRPNQAGRGTGCGGAASRLRLHRAGGLALRCTWAQLRADDDPPGARRRGGRCRGRSAWPADLGDGCRRASHRAGALGGAGRRVPRDQFG